MSKRSRAPAVAALSWVLLLLTLRAVLSPGWLGQVGLLAAALLGAGVLWNLDAIKAAWREDRRTKRGRSLR